MLERSLVLLVSVVQELLLLLRWAMNTTVVLGLDWVRCSAVDWRKSDSPMMPEGLCQTAGMKWHAADRANKGLDTVNTGMDTAETSSLQESTEGRHRSATMSLALVVGKVLRR